MAGTIIADFIRTDANKLSLNVGNTTFATINASGFFSNTGTQLIAANGQISGASLVSGSIPGSAISTTANTIPRSSMTSGAILQVVQVSYNTVYENTLQASEYDMPSILGDGTCNITPLSTTSRIRVATVMQCGQEDTWRINFFKVYYSVAGGSWTQLASAGSASSNYIASHSGGCTPAVGDFVTTFGTTSNIRFKVTTIGHTNGGYLHLNQNNITNTTSGTNTVSVGSTITVTEIAA
jgi:hypothetical protein